MVLQETNQNATRKHSCCFGSRRRTVRAAEPDLSGVSRLDGPGDWVIEIISPESRLRDRGHRFYEYEQGGVREYWLIDPLRKQAELYQLGDEGIFRPVVADDEGKYHSRVLDGLWLQVGWLWQQPTSALMSVLKEWKLI